MKMQRIFGLFISLTLLFLAIGCKKVKPQPPKAEGFDPAIPDQISYLAGPISFRLSELEEKINKSLDPVLISQESKKGKKGGLLPLRVERMGSVQIRYVGERVSFSAPIQVWLINPLKSEEKQTDKAFCQLHVNFNSTLAVTPNWRLLTKAKFADYKWIKKPGIKLFGKEIELTKLADDLLKSQQTRIESAIDSAVYQELRLDKMVKPIWKDLQKPLQLSKEYGLWLLPKPVSIAAATIKGDSQSITIPLRIAFQTKTVLGERPDVVPDSTLPQLQKRPDVPEQSDLHVMSFLRYESINEVLAKTLHKKKFSLGSGMLTIKKASVYGGQRAIIVKADVGGLVRGTLYFRGRPVYDTLTNTLRIEKLGFDANTEQVLVNNAARLLEDHLLDSLQHVLTFPLHDQIEALPRKISQAFEQSNAGQKTDLTIPYFRFVPRRVAVRPDGIQTLINVQSRVEVRVKEL